MLRNIRGIFSAKKVNMGGIILDQAMPVDGFEKHDPFLLIHHWDRPLKGGQKQSEVGVGPHPHRGFSPVTMIYKGSVHHRDSKGNDSIVGPGGAQWMNSGKGIVHSERPDVKLAAYGGDFEIIQFWVNLPSKYKMIEPEYFPITESDIPEMKSKDGKIRIGVIAGEMGEIKSQTKTYNDLLICKITSGKGGKTVLTVPEEFNALIYQLNGKLLLNNSFTIEAKQLIELKNNGNEVDIECLEDSRAILLAGEPIGEPVASYGPFVMNDQSEILHAMQDFQSGKFGELVEKFD